MTEENYRYRTSPFMLRNQFPGPGKWKIPMVPKFEAKEDDFSQLRLIGFDKTNLENNNHLDRMVHFFLYDYKFERVWKNPDTDIERLRRYRAVLTPDFSMYLEMAPILQLYNTFRNRWCGAYWASKGLRVIPTVSWGGESTFDFCFEGIEKGSTVAVSTYMVSAHGDQGEQKDFFLKGYNELLRRVEPERIICYNHPFPEMQGNIVFVDYNLSSWRYLNDDPYVPSKYVKYICGELPLPQNSGIVIKQGFVLRDADACKGMGSAFGAPIASGNQMEGESETDVKWTDHAHKHFPNRNQSWKEIIKSTKNGPAKYSSNIKDIKAFEREAWKTGFPVTNGKNWRVKAYDYIIGATGGKETRYVRIENSANTIHGHPISESEYLKLIK